MYGHPSRMAATAKICEAETSASLFWIDLRRASAVPLRLKFNYLLVLGIIRISYDFEKKKQLFSFEKDNYYFLTLHEHQRNVRCLLSKEQ